VLVGGGENLYADADALTGILYLLAVVGGIRIVLVDQQADGGCIG
jgi:hypothetical protein